MNQEAAQVFAVLKRSGKLFADETGSVQNLSHIAQAMAPVCMI